MLTGVHLGVIGKLVKHESQLRTEAVSLITSKLRMLPCMLGVWRLLTNFPGAITKGDANRMIYKNFDDHITRKHGIVIEGWPLRTFENPSSIGSQVELQVLLNAWKTGATRFRKMDVKEHMVWVENHTNSDPPSSLVAPLPSISPSPESLVTQNSQDHTPGPAAISSMSDTPFNIVHFESPATLPTRTNNISKKPRKTRSDKGKPRKRGVQMSGENTFQANML